jgi:hypothetical protein
MTGREEDMFLPVVNDDGAMRSIQEEERMKMAINHMIAFVLIVYGLYTICRFGFGWDPLVDDPPSNIHISF